MSVDWFRLDDKVAVITGAAQGLGYAVAETLAAAVLFLASDAASFVTGSILEVSGGR